jgi:hypothetical protein
MPEQLTTSQLVEVLRADRREHWERGERIMAETYIERHPALQADPASAVELVYHETLLREELGETFTLEEYLRRFPQLTAQLEPILEVHRALDSDDLVNITCTDSSGPDSLPGWVKFGAPLLQVPGFEILERLGQGGMGVVFKAREVQLQRTVALKMILASTEVGERELSRFRAEAGARPPCSIRTSCRSMRWARRGADLTSPSNTWMAAAWSGRSRGSRSRPERLQNLWRPWHGRSTMRISRDSFIGT